MVYAADGPGIALTAAERCRVIFKWISPGAVRRLGHCENDRDDRRNVIAATAPGRAIKAVAYIAGEGMPLDEDV